MASFASSATTCGARKHAWTNRKSLHSAYLVLPLKRGAANPKILGEDSSKMRVLPSTVVAVFLPPTPALSTGCVCSGPSHRQPQVVIRRSSSPVDSSQPDKVELLEMVLDPPGMLNIIEIVPTFTQITY